MNDLRLPTQRSGFEPPDLAPVIVTERTPTGWRGLTSDGEIYNVTAHVNGEPATIPESLSIQRGGDVIGYRKVEQAISAGVIDQYAAHLAASNAAVRSDSARAYEEINAAMAVAPTMLARYNRAMILLAMGDWAAGFEEFAYCERESDLFKRPQWRAAMDAGLEPWMGQDLRNKKILLIHDHGFGDTIMALRFVPALARMGANTTLMVPQELERLASQIAAPTTRDLVDCDYVCSILMLMNVLQIEPHEIPTAPYLRVDPTLVKSWRDRLPEGTRRIGIAWSVGKMVDGDYPRACPLEKFEQHINGTLFAVQKTDKGFVFEDFYDCAGLMMALDEIVTVDTAAVHLAGAIGHPNVSLMLSHWHSWRWQAPLYDNVTIYPQDAPGDWDSAFSKRK